MPKVPVAKDGEVLDMLGEVWKQHKDTKYFFSNCGRVKIKFKYGEKLIEPYDKKTPNGKFIKMVTINYRPETVARIVYELFIGEIPKGYCIHHKDSCYFNNDVRNLEMITFKESGSKSGRKSRRNKRVYCIDNGKYYKNTIEAGKDLYLTCSAIGLICNGRVKEPSVRVRWAKE